MEEPRGCRICDLGLGGLVQQQATPRTDRRHATGGERGRVLSETGSVSHGGLTQTNQPPVNPGRFTRHNCIYVDQYVRLIQLAHRSRLVYINKFMLPKSLPAGWTLNRENFGLYWRSALPAAIPLAAKCSAGLRPVRAWGPPDARSNDLIDGLENLACVRTQVIGLLLRLVFSRGRCCVFDRGISD